VCQPALQAVRQTSSQSGQVQPRLQAWSCAGPHPSVSMQRDHAHGSVAALKRPAPSPHSNAQLRALIAAAVTAPQASGTQLFDRRRRLAQAVMNSLTVANAYFGPDYNNNPNNRNVPDPADFTATVIDGITVTPSGEPDGSGQYVGSFDFQGRGTAQLQYPSPQETTFLFDVSGNFTQTHTGLGTYVSITFTPYAARVRARPLTVS